MSLNSLGVIAGGGELPQRIVAACRDSGRPVFIAAIKGACLPETVADAPHVWLEMGAVGKMVEAFKQAQCRDVVMAGPVPRPDFRNIKPDWQGVKLLPKVVRAAIQGDDAIIKAVVQFIEAQGFSVVGAEDVVTGLLAEPGALGRIEPGEIDLADIERGVQVARALGASDVGQAVVVRDGVVLGVEAVEGTNQLLERCGALAPPGQGGVLVKLPKPSQERRVDLPTIGAATIAKAVAARLHGIAVEAHGALILDRAEVVREADAAGIFVFGISSPPPGRPQ